MKPTLDRRAMLGKTAAAFATVVVSQGLVACAAETAVAASVDTTGASNNSCVLTAALTEGPYFVDEKLFRADIRADPATGAGSGKKFLRGYQITDGNGQVTFTTIYPGWYSGRAVHIHFMVRLLDGADELYE